MHILDPAVFVTGVGRRELRSGRMHIACLATVFEVDMLGMPVTVAVHEQTREDSRQQAEKMLERCLSNQEIMQMVRQSGMAPQQIGDR